MAELIADNIAVAPMGEGGITFPQAFTGRMYRDFMAAMKPLGDDPGGILANYGQWRAVCTLATVDVTAHGAHCTNDTHPDDVPLDVASWARAALNEWIEPFLAFSSLSAAATGTEPAEGQ